MDIPTSSNSSGTSPQADAAQVKAWLQILHGGDEGDVNSDISGGLIHISSADLQGSELGWRGRSHGMIDSAVKHIMELDAAGHKGIYVRCTTLKGVLKEGGRGKVEDSKMLPGFAADMDIAGPGHKPVRGQLPPDVTTCQAIIAASGLPEPTLWVHSGGGVYPWWMLDEALDISTAEFLATAQSLSEKLHETIARWAADMGWFYSTATKDMARVLRVPGTVNRKIDDDPKMCHVIQPAAYNFHTLQNLVTGIENAYANSPAPKIVEPPRPAPAPRPEGSELRPGDDFNNRAHWADILTPHGWTYMFSRGHTMYWRRPGKDSGEHSATTGLKGFGTEDRLYVFSDATEFSPNEPYSKHAAYTLLNHGGTGATHFASSTRELRGQGFGGELPQFDKAFDATSLVRPAAQMPVGVQAVDEQQPLQATLVVQTNESGPVLGHGELPEIDLGSEQEAIVEIVTLVNRGKIPNVYVKDGQLVRVHPKTSGQCSEVSVVPVTADVLNLMLAQHVRTFKWVSGGKDAGAVRKACAPMMSCLRAVVSNTYWPSVKPLHGVIGTPTMRPDGTLIQDCGYDQTTGLYLGPAVETARIPDEITDEQVRASREFVFTKAFGEFCWSTPGDFANYLALLLSPMMRPYVKTTTPFGMITATTRGSGKTNLTDAIGLLYGQTSQVLPGRTEELQKKITSILAGNSSPVVVFDNLKEGSTISSEILATLITKDKWDDRMLGASRNIEATNDRLWLASGNGLTVGGDMGSRTIMVRLDPKMARPELRQFEMGQFSDWIREGGNREELLYHLLILVQAWIKAGAPKDTDHTMRGFTRWAQTMGGLLKFHGLTGFLGNVDDLAARDTDEEEWGIFLAKWQDIYGTQERLAKELHASAQVDYVMGTQVDRWARCFITDDDGMTPTPKKLGQMLHGKADRFFGPYILRKRRDTVTNATMWWVEKGEG